LASIKAKALILKGTKDLLNPDFEPKEAAKNIADVKVVTISPGTVGDTRRPVDFFPRTLSF
jgi:homoserine O-acetyltransferase